MLLLALALASTETLIGVAQEVDKRRMAREGFRLFSTPRLVLASNQLQCTISNVGGICEWFPDLGGGGGWFPTGTPDEYVFNSGFQIAGITDPEAGPWALDTAGAFFYDGRRGTPHGTHLTPIYDSRDPADLENWPDDAYIDDPDVFAPILQDRKTASQHDTWVQYWDGDPGRNGERSHPMGVKLTQRSMTWNYPSGNESVIYFVIDFENVTSDPEFQRLNELAFFGGDDALPNEGWVYHDVYVAFGADHDVGVSWQDFGTGLLPFDMGIVYHGGFRSPGDFFQFPPSVFHPPFFTNDPGIAGVKYLKSPNSPDTGENIGLSMMSVVDLGQNQAFPESIGTQQLWRYLSGNLDLSLGDPACNIPAEIQTLDVETSERSICYVPIKAGDIRFYQASGPFTLAAGESATVVAAHIVAPTVETMPDGTPSGIIANSTNFDINPPGVPSFHPGFPSSRACDVNGLNCTDVRSSADNAVSNIERGAGWVSYEGPGPLGSLYPADVEHPSNRIDQFAVRVVPGSLLGRALVAQTVFENSFLLGFAPEPPAFYLVPGSDNVTVIWEPSATETLGDPFYEVAGDPESALYNPNYRELDVEGYRIWRGNTRGQLELIKQFDFADSRYYDATCETVAPDEDVGATTISSETSAVVPVIGFAIGDICPFDENDQLERRTDGNLVFNNGSPGGTPGAGVVRMPTSVSIDTAIVSDRDVGQVRPLADTGVPYFYVDNGVVNNFTYFYAVTAFDLNSMASGPHTLRSAMIDQSTVPRADAPNLVGASLQVAMSGDDGAALNPSDPMPTLDPETGIFSGPMPPTDGIEMSLAPLLPRLLPQLQLQVKIDSITTVFDPASDEETPTELCPIGGSSFAVCEKVWMSYLDQDGVQQDILGEMSVQWWGAFGTSVEVTENWVSISIPFDQDALDSFDIPEASGLATVFASSPEAMNFSSAEGPQNRRSGGSSMVARLRHGGSRWFDGTTTLTLDPAKYMRVGHLEGVDTIFAPIGYTPFNSTTPSGGGQIDFEKQCHDRANALYGRQADVQVTWGEGGAITVRDITHNVDVPTTGYPDATYGFVQDANGNGVIDWQDFNGMLRVLDQFNDETFSGGSCDGYSEASGGPRTAVQWNIPQAQPLLPTASLQVTHVDNFEYGWADPVNGAATWTGTGVGFGLYISGQRFIFQLTALPAPGTVWTLRSYSGGISSDAATFDTDDPAGYAYDPTATNRSTGRPILIPNLVFNWLVEEATNFDGPTDLTQVHTVPDPYLTTSRYDLAPSTKQLMFVNLPPAATLRIYSVSGILVDILNHDDPTGGGRAVWNVRNRNNQFVASGVYFFHVVTPDGYEHVGKFTILNRSSN